MEENYHPESGPISKPADPHLDLLNRHVNRFSDGVGRLQLNRILNSAQMSFDRSPNLDHWLQPAPRDLEGVINFCVPSVAQRDL